MNLDIKTNKLQISIKHAKLLEQYSVYKITNSSKNTNEYKLFYAGVRDTIQPLAHAVDGKYTLIISDNSDIIRKYSKKYEIKHLHFAELQQEKDVILLKLINSLLVYKSKYFQIDSDPYGLYFIVEKKGSKILTINIDIDRNKYLSLNLVTFIKSNSNKDRYVLQGNKLVRAGPNEKTNQFYIRRNFAKTKSTYKFLGLMMKHSQPLIQESKIYVLIKYIEAIKKYFGDIVSLEFHQMKTYQYDAGKEAKDKKQILKNKVKDAIKTLSCFHIANLTGVDLKSQLDEMKSRIKSFINADVKITHSNSIREDRCNITITQSEEYYERHNVKDPYEAIKKNDTITQNITIETFKKLLQDKKDSLLYVILKELVVKKEIAERKIVLPYSNSITDLVVIYPHKKEKKYFFYKLSIDKSQLIFNELTDKERSICKEIAFSIENNELLEAILCRGENINYIVKTKEFPLPKINEIKSLIDEYHQPISLPSQKILEIWNSVYSNEQKEKMIELKNKLIEDINKYKNILNDTVELTSLTLGKNNNKFKIELENYVGRKLVVSLKGKKEFRHIIESLIGIQYGETESKYFIGVNDNIPQAISNASPIRKVCVYQGENLLYKEILPMLSEYFVKNGDFTVLPYPLKYIREYYIKYTA